MTVAQPETRSFEAETTQLLQLVAHSLYSNKEIFMRELISNASDAADKLRYEALSDAALFEGDAELKIKITFNKELNTITLVDNGIGMSRQEVIENLGTIARSGTRAFKELLSGEASKDSQLIGQFGVGFYSAFIVADRVIVKTRRAGMTADQGVYWESEGLGEYTVKNIVTIHDSIATTHSLRVSTVQKHVHLEMIDIMNKLTPVFEHLNRLRLVHPAHDYLS